MMSSASAFEPACQFLQHSCTPHLFAWRVNPSVELHLCVGRRTGEKYGSPGRQRGLCELGRGLPWRGRPWLTPLRAQMCRLSSVRRPAYAMPASPMPRLDPICLAHRLLQPLSPAAKESPAGSWGDTGSSRAGVLWQPYLALPTERLLLVVLQVWSSYDQRIQLTFKTSAEDF